MMDRIGSALLAPLNFIAKKSSKIFENEHLSIACQAIILTVYLFRCRGIGAVISGLYENTDPAIFTSLLFGIAKGQYQSIFDINALLGAGIIMFMQNIYLDACNSRGENKTVLYLKNLFFLASISAFVSLVINGCIRIGKWIPVLKSLFMALALYLIIVSLFVTICNIGMMFKVLVVGLIAEYALLAVIVLISLLLMLVLALIVNILPANLALTILSSLTAFTGSLKNSLLSGTMPDWYEATVANIVMLAGYVILLIRERAKDNCPVENSDSEELLAEESHEELQKAAPVESQCLERNKWVALFLCLCLGCFGAHKFYEHKYFLGILYMLTFGLFLVGVIVDLISLIRKPNPYYVIKSL